MSKKLRIYLVVFKKMLIFATLLLDLRNIVARILQQSYTKFTMITNNLTHSFEPGLQKITLQDLKCVKKQISDVLRINNRQNFCRKKKGIKNISKEAYDSVTAIFAQYGVPESEVWRVTERLKK